MKVLTGLLVSVIIGGVADYAGWVDVLSLLAHIAHTISHLF